MLKWSGWIKVSDQKRSIPLVCELRILERRYAKLEANEDYGEVFASAHEGKVGWSQVVECYFLLKCKAKA